MNSVTEILFLIAFLIGFSASAQAQDVRPRISGLEQDSVYISLLQEELVLKNREDSLTHAVRDKRAFFASDTTNRGARAAEILRLEETIFNTRNQAGTVASKINIIEQEFILNNLSRSDPQLVTSEQTPATNLRNLTDNAYFRENLSAEEYRQLRDGNAAQNEIDRLIAAYKTGYEQLGILSDQYAEAMTRTASDSLYLLYRTELSGVRRIESDFEAEWGGRFNQEQYLYSYLLDKLNKMNELATLNETAKARRISNPDEVMSVLFAEYPSQRMLLIDYELALAGALKLTSAADSLQQTKVRLAAENLAFPKIEVTEKEFVHYEDASFPDISPYNVDNPIPELWIPETGTYYSVTVGTFSTKQPVSTFRRASPVYYERLHGGQWRYHVGLFRSYGDAADAVTQLKTAGFRRPEAVRWVNKEYQNLTAEQSKTEGLFRIKISGIPGELSEDTRLQLNRYARNKEITRVGNSFYVGTFTNRLHVEDVMSALSRIDGLDLIVEELEE